MSNIAILPFYQVESAVQSNEDWRLAFLLTYNDGVTALDLTGISFNASFGAYMVAGVKTGALSNIVTFSALAAEVATWTEGVYPLTILATANDGSRDLVGYSTLTVGEPQVTPFIKPLISPLTILSLAPPPSVSAAELAALPRADRLALINALLAALPHVTNGEAIPATGLPYADADGFYADAQ